MERLHDLDKAEVFKRQTLSPARVYSTDSVQHVRIARARAAVKSLLMLMRNSTYTAHESKTVVELGANSCDISGQISMGHFVHAWEVSPQCVEYITRTYPWVKLHAEDIETAEPIYSDLLILCEILEHLTDPNELVKKWLPKARYAVISSPLKGDLQGDLSGGEHVWSLEGKDFDNFVEIGGHVLIEKEIFQMGQYRICMMATKRKEQHG